MGRSGRESKGAAQENKQEENTQIQEVLRKKKRKRLRKKKVSKYKEMLKTIQNNVRQSWLPRKTEEVHGKPHS